MYCKICGTEYKVKFRPSKLQNLCEFCNKETPKKMSKHNFDKKYWGKDFESVPQSVRSEFYSDYLASSNTFKKYLEETVDII